MSQFCKVVSVETTVSIVGKSFNAMTLECGKVVKRKRYKYRNVPATIPKKIKCNCKEATT